LTLVVTAAVLIVLTPLWYRLARMTTDDWALAVRALVDLGRRPLAESLGLNLPRELDREREMWSLYSQMVLWPYDADRAAELDEFRLSGTAILSGEELDQRNVLGVDGKEDHDLQDQGDDTNSGATADS
jgi:hypothetical protein